MSDGPVRFTKHAEQKFSDLAELGFFVTSEQVIDTILDPESVNWDVYPPVAQKPISDHHVLRVVFTETVDGIVVITFYPAKRGRYEL